MHSSSRSTRTARTRQRQGFDPKSIVQYGFEPQRDDIRGLGAYYGAGNLAAADGTTAQVPDPWADAWKDWYDGMWTNHTVMTGPVFESEEFGAGEYAFFSGRVAMSNNFLWTTYGVAQCRRRLGSRRDPVARRQGHITVERRYVPDPQGFEAPG